ncbi:MAG: acylphosphatase [Rhodospirillales bacterium]|nr:acylphosphatase [Rhodospirillales bacterium]
MTVLERTTYRVRVTGRVQGVCFRDWTRNQACRLQISGWVRNRRDGSVEALISGSPEKIQEMLNVFEVGPSAANVTSIRLKSCGPPLDRDFKQLVTA